MEVLHFQQGKNSRFKRKKKNNILRHLQMVPFFSPNPFGEPPQIRPHYFPEKNSARNPFIINCWWKIMVTSKIQPMKQQSFDKPQNIEKQGRQGPSEVTWFSLPYSKGRYITLFLRFLSSLHQKTCSDRLPQRAFRSYSEQKNLLNIFICLLFSTICNLWVETSANKRDFLWEMGGLSQLKAGGFTAFWTQPTS